RASGLQPILGLRKSFSRMRTPRWRRRLPPPWFRVVTLPGGAGARWLWRRDGQTELSAGSGIAVDDDEVLMAGYDREGDARAAMRVRRVGGRAAPARVVVASHLGSVLAQQVADVEDCVEGGLRGVTGVDRRGA